MKLIKYSKIFITVIVGVICLVSAMPKGEAPQKCELKKEIKEEIKKKITKKNSYQITY